MRALVQEITLYLKQWEEVTSELLDHVNVRASESLKAFIVLFRKASHQYFSIEASSWQS